MSIGLELRCKSCGSPLFKYVNFRNNTNKVVCVNCNNINPSDANGENPRINENICESNHGAPYKLTPLQEQQNKKESEQSRSLVYSTTGKLLNPATQVLYRKVFYHEDNPTININVNEVAAAAATIPEGTNQSIKKHAGKIIIDWSKIIGYEPIKFAITQTLNSKSKKKTHMLIVGAAGTSKTVFLNVIEENLKKQNLNVHYLDATTLTSSGVIQYLFDNDIEFALIDEIDKLEKEHQRTFLNLLESGLLQETKFKRIRRKEMKNTIFIATGNYIEKIMHPLLTRFMTFKIPEYTKEEFHTIGVQLLTQQYDKTPEIAYYIVSQIWNIYTEIRHEKPNLRYARDVANLSDNDKSTIDPLLEAQKKYSQNYEE